MADRVTVADEAETYLREHQAARRRLWAQLERINATVARWEEYLANEELPADLRRPLELPSLSLEAWVLLR